jgi:hypothetical protein
MPLSASSSSDVAAEACPLFQRWAESAERLVPPRLAGNAATLPLGYSPAGGGSWRGEEPPFTRYPGGGPSSWPCHGPAGTSPSQNSKVYVAVPPWPSLAVTTTLPP